MKTIQEIQADIVQDFAALTDWMDKYEYLIELGKEMPLIDEKDKTLFPYVDLERFRENNFVMVNNPRITPLCLQMCSNAGYKPRISLQPSTWEHVIMGVRSGNGVGFLSNLHIGRDNSEGLRFFRIPSELAKLQHVVAWRPSYTFSPGARTFIDSFRSYVESNLQVLTQHDHRSN